MNRARELKLATLVKDQLRVARKAFLERQRQQSLTAITNFEADVSGKNYPNLFCGSWIATEDGIESQESSRANQRACYHPILPVRRLRNKETGEEQITIAFKRDGLWNELTVPKDMIASAKTIVNLAKYGVSVNSENAKLLVRYLSDVENFNQDLITLVHSSSKLGWHGKIFLPYDKSITFDAALRFPQITGAIKEHGSYDIWLNHMRKIRASQYTEPKIVLAASFSSIIVPLLNITSVIVDANGVTEAGKTVQHMVATSVWACPDEGQYMGDFMTTDTELEVRCDLLNNLPVILDDTSKMKKSISEDIDQVIYRLASGTGKKRSNIDLGSERVRTWKTTFIINGERPLNSLAKQAGAINRVLEIDLTGVKLFDDPSETAEIVRNNYGFAGKRFVEYIKTIDKKTIKDMHQKYTDALNKEDSMQKQTGAMAAILTADELATQAIFCDGNNLKVSDVSKYLVSRSTMEEGARCYEYLIGIFDSKGQHFDLQYDNLDQWGECQFVDEERYINFNIVSFNQLMKEADFSRKAFTSWADRNGLLRHNKSTDTLSVKILGTSRTKKVISVKIVDLDEYEHEKNMFS